MQNWHHKTLSNQQLRQSVDALILREHVRGVELIYQQGTSSCCNFCNLSFHFFPSLAFIQQKVGEGQHKKLSGEGVFLSRLLANTTFAALTWHQATFF